MERRIKLQSKKYFLTYPKCPLTPEVLLEKLKVQAGVEEYTIASELHQDNTPHLHAVVILSRSPNTTNMRYFDIDGYHPNIKSLKTKNDYEKAGRYCLKDGNFITNVEKRLGARAALMQALIESKEGLTPEFVRRHPEIMVVQFDTIKKWLDFLRPELRYPPIKLLPKRRHLWISGPSNSGKSYFLTAFIQLFFNPQDLPRNNDYSGFDSGTDVIYSDEYRGHLTIQELNRLCDGRCRLNTKGGSTSLGYPLIIIVSNYTIAECYKNSTQSILETLYNRFQQYVAPLFPKFPTCEL